MHAHADGNSRQYDTSTAPRSEALGHSATAGNDQAHRLKKKRPITAEQMASAHLHFRPTPGRKLAGDPLDIIGSKGETLKPRRHAAAGVPPTSTDQASERMLQTKKAESRRAHVYVPKANRQITTQTEGLKDAQGEVPIQPTPTAPFNLTPLDAKEKGRAAKSPSRTTFPNQADSLSSDPAYAHQLEEATFLSRQTASGSNKVDQMSNAQNTGTRPFSEAARKSNGQPIRFGQHSPVTVPFPGVETPCKVSSSCSKHDRAPSRLASSRQSAPARAPELNVEVSVEDAAEADLEAALIEKAKSLYLSQLPPFF
ncbi:hypothetical protein P389DRAFT_171766 [Cystobasidium minutum MCA 4210]|uniref:uncharacterized protein n=1 Tax=Cystobasidium minutum MCA 4210 TaxID=1397322 RepID=UPI0034CEB555|eukprot:jgi/Rhomi1/171766/fgenesh1_kg.4_\